MKKGIWAAILLTMLIPAVSGAEIVEEPVLYKQGDAVLNGFAVYDKAVTEKRPGVLVVHEWWGINDFVKQKAKALAEMGYVAFVADMYGEGRSTTDSKQAAQWAGEVRNTGVMRPRAAAALDTLKEMKAVDPARLAAIGFCFGGTTVLELAYSGAELNGVVTFHGGLTLPREGEAEKIKPALLILHGSEDPHVKSETILSLEKALKQANVDWQMIFYGGAVHAFTNPNAGSDKSAGVAYNPAAARRSWKHMEVFLDEIFGK